MKKLIVFLTALLVLGGTIVAYSATESKPFKVQGIEHPQAAAALSAANRNPERVTVKKAPRIGDFSFEQIENWSGVGSKKAALVIQWNDDRESSAMVFGYRWDGDATGADMLKAVVTANPQLYILMQYTNVNSPTDPDGGYTINAIGWDFNEDGYIAIQNENAGDFMESRTGFFEHPRGYDPNDPYNSHPDYDYDDWTSVDPEDYFYAGWYQGYWSYWCGDFDQLGYSGWGASARVLEDGDVDAWFAERDMAEIKETGSENDAWMHFEAAPATGVDIHYSNVDVTKLRNEMGHGNLLTTVVINFNNQNRLDNIVLGIRTQGELSIAETLNAIANSDSRLSVSATNNKVNSLGFDLNGDGVIDDKDTQATGGWTVDDEIFATNGYTRVIYLNHGGVGIDELPYLFYAPKATDKGIWVPEAMTVKLSDEGFVLPVLVQPQGETVASITNWQASSTNTGTYKLDRTKIATPYTLIDDTYNARPTFVGATGTTYVRYRPQLGKTYTESNYMTLTIEAPKVPMTKIITDEPEVTVGLGKTYTPTYTYLPENATYTAVNLKTDNTKIGSVSANVIGSSNNEGEATITVTSKYDANVSTTFKLIRQVMVKVAEVNFGEGTEEGIITLTPKEMIGLRPVILPEDADLKDVTLALSNNGTSLADATCSMYRVNYWDENNVRSQFYELSGHRLTNGNDAILKVSTTDGYERKFHIQVVDVDRSPLAESYEEGTIVLNEEWFGHTNGGLNYFPSDGSAPVYQAYERENEGMSFGCTSQYGIIWNGYLIVSSKQAVDGGDPLPGGGRLVIADAKTLKRLGSIDTFMPDGTVASQQADGRGVAGATPDKIYFGTSRGIYIVDISDPTHPVNMGQIGSTDTEDESQKGLYDAQIGDMLNAGKYVYAIRQNLGIYVIDPETDQLVTTVAEANIQGITQSADGTVWISTISKDDANKNCTTFVPFASNGTELDSENAVQMPAAIGTVSCSWGAWRTTQFFGQLNDNCLWFSPGSAITNGGDGVFYRWEIGSDPSGIKPFFDISAYNEISGDMPQMTYGTSRFDDRSNELIVMTTKKNAASGNYRDHWTHFIDGSTGEVLRTHHLRPYYWFQALPIFPDKHEVVFHESLNEVNLTSGGAPVTYDLSELITDADNIDSNIRVWIEEPSQQAYTIRKEVPAKAANVSLIGKTLTIKPLAEGTHNFTLFASSNGKVASMNVPVSVSTVTGINSIYGNQCSIKCDGQRLIVNGYAGVDFTVCNVNGVALTRFTADSDNYVFDFGGHNGIFIISGSNGVATKVIIR